MHTLNDGVADTVKCDELRVLYGRDYYMEEIFGLKFRVNIFSFFQTNVEAVERLYSRAVDLIDDFSGKNVLDLYCGTGTISQVMARKAGHVLGIELVPESVGSARRNAAINGLDNCEFACGDVFEVLDSLNLRDSPDAGSDAAASAGVSPDFQDSVGTESLIAGTAGTELIASETAGAGSDITGSAGCESGGVELLDAASADIVRYRPDVIVVDPPRAGMTPNAVNKIISYGVPQIVYISCNPKTLVKNLVQFTESGYEVKYVKPYDNFPMTRHVETVVLLTHN
jgi:tRNA/tmRNA/rRNA uracil-C5-methylase (TrmA/RlmC/RlmD family)